MQEKKNVSTETIIRTIVIVSTLINSMLTMFGKNPLPFAEEDVYAALSSFATVAATLWVWWKNNSFTTAAITADKYMADMKTKESKQ